MKRLFLSLLGVFFSLFTPHPVQAELRVGATVVDITPVQFPVIVNGQLLTRTARRSLFPKK